MSEKESKIKFRPHHFLCMRYWVGNGYSEKYTDFVNEIFKVVTEKIMNADLFTSICGDCSWAKFCH